MCAIEIRWFHLNVVQILLQSHVDLVSSILALKATELVSQPVTQMVFEMINFQIILALFI